MHAFAQEGTFRDTCNDWYATCWSMSSMTTPITRVPADQRRHDGLNLALITGLGLTVALFARNKVHNRARTDHGSAPLATYLSEHVAGADAAIRTVERLRRTQDNPDDRRLFSTLFDDFRSDRA